MSYELISDLYKDATGSRPDATFFDAFVAQSEADKATQWNALCDMLAEREADEQTREADAQLAFNNRLAGMMADYDIDMATAMRWDMDVVESTSLDRIPLELRAQEIAHYLFNQGVAIGTWPAYIALLNT